MAQPEIPDHNSPAVVTFMTTEHFVLQTARSAGIAELNGRAGFYLAAVSSGLIKHELVPRRSLAVPREMRKTPRVRPHRRLMTERNGISVAMVAPSAEYALDGCPVLELSVALILAILACPSEAMRHAGLPA